MEKQLNIKVKLITLGFHIGHSVQTVKNQKYLTNIILGVRNSYHIFNLNTSIYFLKKALLFVKHSNTKLCNNLFFYSLLSNESNNLMVKSFLNHLIFNKTRSSFIHMKWTHGLITNYRICFLRFIRLISTYYKKRKYNNNLSFRRFFSKTFFFSFFFRLLFLLNEKKKLNLDLYSEFKKVVPLFKVVIFLKYWQCFFSIPDIAYVVNNENLNSPIHEFNSVKIPVVSTIDTANIINDVSYIVPFNDDSVVMVFFFFSMLSNLIRRSRTLYFSFLIR